MSAWPSRLLFAAGVLVALACSFEPLARAGFCGSDYAALARAGVDPERPGETQALAPLWELTGADLYQLEGSDGSLLAGLSLARSVRMWGAFPWERFDGVHPALGFRMENLVLAVLGAIGLGLLVSRLLRPWSGSEHARAAGRATGLLFLFYPLGYSWIASLAGRGPLLGLAFGSWSMVAFLKARQDRRFALSLVAMFCSILAALATEYAVGLPFGFALAELVSAHRSRPRRERMRTSLTTLVVYGAAVGLVFMARAWYMGDPPLPGITGSIADLDEGRWTRVALFVFEKLGVLILPANGHTLGFLGTALAGLLFLAALHPALRAARTAPRLWGWLLFIWAASLFIAQVPGMWRRVTPLDLSSARHLLLAALVMAMGLGIASTARSGVLRWLLPWVVVAGFVFIGRGNAAPWSEASEVVASLRDDLEAAREEHGADATYCVIDPPRTVSGVEAVGGELAAVLGRPGSLEGDGPELLGLAQEAFRAFVREPEFDELRRASVVVLLATDEESARTVIALPAPRAELPGGNSTWRGDSRSADLDIDPLSVGALRLVAGAAEDAGLEARAAWSARSELASGMTTSGVWLSSEGTPEAFFDLSGSLAWLLSGQVRRVWFAGLPIVGRAELVTGFPEFGQPMIPDSEDGDWYFPAPGVEWIDSTEERGTWVLGLLDLGRYRYAELDGERGPSGTIRIPRAADRVERIVRRTLAPVAWYLEYRVEDVPVVRASGRRIGRSGTQEQTKPR